MIKVIDVDYSPLSYLGHCAGICYGQRNPNRYKAIAESCILSEHDRVEEFPTITMEISEYSAKAIRDIYTHIIGTTRLGSSTRYIDYSKGFDFSIPPSVLADPNATKVWCEHMNAVDNVMSELKLMGIPVEDFTGLLPLAYHHTIVLKINLRALVHMFHVRSCTLAYHECRELMKEIKKTILDLDDVEWTWIANNLFVPKCKFRLYCTENKNRSCGLMPNREDVEALVKGFKEVKDGK